jgi:hypothetical protein
MLLKVQQLLIGTILTALISSIPSVFAETFIPRPSDILVSRDPEYKIYKRIDSNGVAVLWREVKIVAYLFDWYSTGFYHVGTAIADDSVYKPEKNTSSGARGW